MTLFVSSGIWNLKSKKVVRTLYALSEWSAHNFIRPLTRLSGPERSYSLLAEAESQPIYGRITDLLRKIQYVPWKWLCVPVNATVQWHMIRNMQDQLTRSDCRFTSYAIRRI